MSTGKTNSGGIDFIYRCTGINDTTIIQNIVNDFIGFGEAKSMKLIIVGNMGLGALVSNTYIRITTANTRGSICHLDFSNCTIPESDVASINATFIGLNSTNSNIYIYGLSCKCRSNISVNAGNIYISHCNIYGGNTGISTSNATVHIDNCNIISDTKVTGISTNTIYIGTNSMTFIDNCNIINYVGPPLSIGGGKAYINKCKLIGEASDGSNYISGAFTSYLVMNSCDIKCSSMAFNQDDGQYIFNNCNIELSNSVVGGIFTNTNFKGMLSFNGCRIIISNCVHGMWIQQSTGIINIINTTMINNTSNGIGISASTGIADLCINIINNSIKSAQANISALSSTISWFIEGNIFSSANIYINSSTASTGVTASATIWFPPFANKFNKTISIT